MRLKTTGIVVALALGLLPALPSAAGESPAKAARVGFLGSSPPTTPEASRLLEAFRQGLSELGYSEGQNIAIEYRWAEGRMDRFSLFAAELVRLRVDVIVSVGTPGARAAQQATGTIPIVMVGVGEPVPGFVSSLARPGGNITGLGGLGRQATWCH